MLIDNISEQQINEIRTAVKAAGGIYKFAKKNNINRGHVSLAYNGKYLSPMMCDLMGWGRTIKIPQSTLKGLKQDREKLKEEIEVLDAVINQLYANQIPAGTVPTEPCPNCLKVHTVPWCVDEYGEPVKPKPKRKRSTRTRIAADVTEAQRERLHEMADANGISYSEMIRAIADGDIKLSVVIGSKYSKYYEDGK